MFAETVFSNFEPLVPQETMGRNELCWCRSGRKWKSCHRDRHLKKQLPASAYQAEIKQQSKFELCMHPDAPHGCSGRAIRAHTVQRATALVSIAEKNHVLSGRDIRPGQSRDNTLAEISINKASTFRGFCGAHDNIAFREADTATHMSRRVAFLLGYRALSYELYMKIISKPTLEMYREGLDAGRDFADQANIQQYLNGMYFTTKLAIREHSKLKAVWDSALLSGIPESFKWISYAFDQALPVVTSGAFYPEYDFGGKHFQELNAPIGALALLTFQLISLNGKSHLVFAWLDNKPQNVTFCDSLERIDPNIISSAVVKFCFDTSDNIFVRPSWWNGLDPDIRSSLQLLLYDSTPGNKSFGGLTPFENEIVSARLVSTERDSL